MSHIWFSECVIGCNSSSGKLYDVEQSGAAKALLEKQHILTFTSEMGTKNKNTNKEKKTNFCTLSHHRKTEVRCKVKCKDLASDA